MITSNGIQYTWKQIFTRLGVSEEENHLLIGNKSIEFHYLNSDEIHFHDEIFHLVILKGDPENLDLICDDPEFPVTRLPKTRLLPNSLIDFPLDELPVLFQGNSGNRNRFAEIINQKVLVIQPDLIQSIFFLLSRYEEFHLNVTDSHGRFPYSASTAHRYGLVELPLVDLYVIVLKKWLEELTGVEIPEKKKFEIALSHDVDFLSPYRPFANWLKTAAKDVLRLDVSGLIEDIGNIDIPYERDPYFQGIKHLARTSADHGLTSVFNLMAAPPSKWDEGYSLTSEEFKQAVQAIQKHGHQIGLHASYRSYDHPELLHEEKMRLEKAIGADVSIVRQHFLRLQTPQSWEAWDTAGFSKDTSYGYSEHEGFRCGTCRPYTVFDLQNDCELRLIEEPLVIMDTTLKTYRNLPVHEGIEKIHHLAKMCKAMNGKFTLLWHNSSFFRNWQAWGNFYPDIIAGLAKISAD